MTSGNSKEIIIDFLGKVIKKLMGHKMKKFAILFIFLCFFSIGFFPLYAQDDASDELSTLEKEKIEKQNAFNNFIKVLIPLVISFSFVLLFSKKIPKPIITALLVNTFILIYSLLVLDLFMTFSLYLLLFIGLFGIFGVSDPSGGSVRHRKKDGSTDKRYKIKYSGYSPEPKELAIHTHSLYTLITAVLIGIIGVIILVIIRVIKDRIS